jgi:hypothetical protein
MEFIIGLLSKLIDWIFSWTSARRQKANEVSNLAFGFKIEINQIKKEIETRIPIEHPQEKIISGNINFTYGIPDSLGRYYQDNMGRKCMLGDEVLINNIDEYYDKFEKWKIERLKVKNIANGKQEFNPIRSPLKEKKVLEKWLMKMSDELAVELGKRIKK